MPGNIAQCLILTADGSEAGLQAALLLGREGIDVTSSTTRETCLNLLAKRHWRLLVVDATDGNQDFIKVMSQCKAVDPEIGLLALVERSDIRTAVRAMKAGAADCIEQPIDKTRLSAAVNMLCGQANNRPAKAKQTLTKTERLVLHHILKGRTSTEVAEQLCRSPRTIDVHRRNIMKKMNVDSIVELVRQTLKTHSDF